jgi:hypothetical protein
MPEVETTARGPLPRSVSARGRVLSRLGASSIAALLGVGCARPAPAAYQPRLRAFTVTTVPLLIREQQELYGFLGRDFAPGGVLEGKEVYAFQPSTLVAYRGDTLVLRLVNPEDDLHTFVLDGHRPVQMAPQSTVADTVVASRTGLYRFVCDLPSHSPYMYGQLVILSP